jgi:hypothetical protein
MLLETPAFSGDSRRFLLTMLSWRFALKLSPATPIG